MLSIDHIILHPLNYIWIKKKKRGNGDCECQREGTIHGVYIFEH